MHKTDLLFIRRELNSSTALPTVQAYGELHAAFNLINAEQFDNRLPPCLITLQRRSIHIYGYFSRSRFRSNRQVDLTTDEIAMNPIHFKGRDIKEVLQTLAHEMTHQWQHHFGKPSRAGYHNWEWARKMQSIGLHPSSTGKPGGAMVGQHVADYLVEDGPLAKTIDALLAKGFGISWYDRIADLITESIGGGGIEGAATGNVLPRPIRSGRRVKYHCSKCKLNAWAKPGARLICADCQLPMRPQSSPARNNARPHASQAVR